MKRNFLAAAILLSLAGTAATAQSPTAPVTPSAAVWTDPSTGLLWRTMDNGKDITWKGAVKYCHQLRLGTFADWRMPNMDEIQHLYDKKVESPGLSGAKAYHNVQPALWHVRGGLFLSGGQWTTLRGYTFSFNDGKSFGDSDGWPYTSSGMRVLCVRGPQEFPIQRPSNN